MWVGVLVVGWGLWLLTSGSKKSGETEVRPETQPAEFTEWIEVERTPFVSTKINPNPSGYYCIERRDYMQESEILFSQFRVQVKGSDNDYTVSTVFDSLDDAQAQVQSMNQPPSKEDYDLAEEKGLIPDSGRSDSVFSTPEFGGKA